MRVAGVETLLTMDMPARLHRPWPAAVAITLSANSKAEPAKLLTSSRRLQATRQAKPRMAEPLVGRGRARYWKPAERNRITPMDRPETAGPCQGTMRCMKLGASDANRLNMPKAQNAHMPPSA